MNSDNIAEAKRRFPLPDLMRELGDGDRAKPSALCPFHKDKGASFSAFKTKGDAWCWKCFSGCGAGDEIDYLAKRKGLTNGEAIKQYLALAGVDNRRPERQSAAAFDWAQCLAAFTDTEAAKLATWRGYSPAFVRWLHAQGELGLYESKPAFANRGDAGKVVSCHFRLANGKWNFEPKGHRTAPLVFGDTKAAGFILVFESQWDAFAVMDKLGWHTANGLPDTAIFISRGASNGKLIRGRLSPDAACYAFTQNDEPAQGWLADIASNAGCKVLNVATPAPHKDANDWTKGGATGADIEAAIRNAKPTSAASTPGEKPPENFETITAELRGQIIGALTDKQASGSEKGRVIAGLVVAALCKIGRFYFHTELKDFDSAMWFNAHRKQLLRIRADAFIAWLSEWLHLNRAENVFKYVTSEIETTALSSRHTTGILPETFWAARLGALYLSNGDGAVVKITAAGVELVDNGTDGVLFSAGRTLAPWKLTAPQDPFETCSLFQNAHSSATHGRLLLQLWFYSFATMPRSKPPLVAIGEIGSGKTRTLKGIAELYGIPFRAAKVEEQLESNFWPNVNEGGLFTLDNADSKCRWLADAVAAAATDGCSPRRKLYTNSETVMLRANAWLAITSANPTFGNDAGLADRVLLVRMERSGEDTCDAALTDEILAARDAGLSHIAETLHKALADTAPTPHGLNARHPDFAAFAVRIGRALGREADAIAALKAAEADKSAFCLENDAIAAALLAYLREAESFTGTAAELAPKLCEADPDLKERLSAKRLGKRLVALWPHLQKALKKASKEADRKGFTVFRFQSAEFAEFQMAFSQNPPRVCTQ